MTKSARYALLIILTLIFCDCDETTSTTQTNTSVSNYQIDGAQKVTVTNTQMEEVQNETTKKNVTQYNQQKFRVEKANDLALEMQKNMSNGDISDFLQKLNASKNSNSAAAEKMRIYETNLDNFLENYINDHKTESVTQNGNIRIETKTKFTKDNREIFYDPQFMTNLWSKASLLIERNELTPENHVYELLDTEFLKDDIVDYISLIKKSTWFVFKYSRFMPFWVETITYLTDPEFLSAATKDELIYMQLYTKKLFKIFTHALIGNKTKKGVKLFFVIFAQVTMELAEYEFSVNLLFKHIKPELKSDMKVDFSNLLVNQTKILETIKYVRENKYMEAIDPSMSSEMEKLDEMVTKMRNGIQLSLGDIEVTTIIKTKVIDIKKKIMKRIMLLLNGSIMEQFYQTKYHDHLIRMLKALEDLLNSHIMDNDENIETILEAMDLFLIKLEEYLTSMSSNPENYSVNKNLHSDLMSSVAFFLSKVENAQSIKAQDAKRKYAFFLMRVQLFLLSLEKPIKGDEIKYDFDKTDTNDDAFGELPNNIDDLFGEYEDLDDDPVLQDSYRGLKKAGERTLYIIERNIDLNDRPIDKKLLNFFNQFKDQVKKIAQKKSMLQPFYMRMFEIFTESEKNLSILLDMDFAMKLQNLYLKIKQISESQEDFEDQMLSDGSKLGQVLYAYNTYRETLHKQVPELVRHISFVCSKCDPQILAGISNEMTSFKSSIVDILNPSNRLGMDGDSLEKDSKRVVYVVEVLDCENSNIFVKLIQKKNRRLI